MTRDSDSFISLSRRVEVSAQAGSSIFISIHYNHAKNPQAQGVEIFYYESKENRTRAAASKHLAEAILPGLIKRTEAVSRGVKKGNFLVLRENSVPSILIEGGFLSNVQECTKIKNPKYLDQIARGIVDGVDHYLKKMTK
jgi:N-acetylmuramoyl-L-alanine amidase